MFKVIIAGGRNFNDFQKLCSTMDHLLQNKTDITIISGGARGADTLGEKYARLREYKLIVMKADWDKNGKRAGFLRNMEMLNITDGVVCFWNGKSRGTGHMINITISRRKEPRVIYY